MSNILSACVHPMLTLVCSWDASQAYANGRFDQTLKAGIQSGAAATASTSDVTPVDDSEPVTISSSKEACAVQDPIAPIRY